MLTEALEPVNTLYAGDGGSGKTTAIARMANGGKLFLVNAESGVKSRALKKRGVAVENIEIFPGPDEELSFESLEGQWLRIREELHEDPNAYFGVGWDSITEIHKALLDAVVAKAVIKADRVGKERDPNFIALEDYGVMTEQVRSLMRKYRDLPCHFAASALLRRDQDDDGTVTYNPAITPKLGLDLVGWMDIVCVTSVALVDGDEEYRGLFRPHGKYRGKDRLGVMPKWLVDPYFDRVLGYVEEEMTIENDPVMAEAKVRFDRAEARRKAEEETKNSARPAAAATTKTKS